MARRTKKGDSGLIILVAIIGLPFVLLAKLIERIGMGWFIFIMTVLIGGVIWYQLDKAKEQRETERLLEEAQRQQIAERLAALTKKYGDQKIAEAIMRRAYWQGQTSEQLKDSLGPAVDIDEKVLKTKRKEVWKYFPAGGNRYGLRITLENDQVIGWDEKT